MPASTHVITDITSVITNGPNGATQALANAPSGYIMDYQGNCNLLLTKMQEVSILLAEIVADTDSTDATNLTLLNNIALTFS